MTDTEPFALIVVLTAAAGLVAVLSSRLTGRVKIPLACAGPGRCDRRRGSGYSCPARAAAAGGGTGCYCRPGVYLV